MSNHVHCITQNYFFLFQVLQKKFFSYVSPRRTIFAPNFKDALFLFFESMDTRSNSIGPNGG